jgi:diacylglycerol kinase family enzyme
MLFDGSHIGHSKIMEKKVASISIESDDRFLVEVDGDVLGESPASFCVITAALTILV